MAKRVPANIDANSILDSIRPDVPPPITKIATEQDAASIESKAKREVKEKQPSILPSKSKPAQKISAKGAGEGYVDRFLKTSPMSTRSGKLVSIRMSYHKSIMKIIRVIGNDEVSIFSYIDNVLSQHFEEYEDEIEKLYETNLEEGVFER